MYMYVQSIVHSYTHLKHMHLFFIYNILHNTSNTTMMPEAICSITSKLHACYLFCYITASVNIHAGAYLGRFPGVPETP